MKKSCMKRGRGNLLRKVRIIVSDPYATDDSSGDELFELPNPPKGKRIVHEINLPFNLSECSQDCHGGLRTSRHKASRQPNKPVGARLRRSGKWVAEIRNPISRTKEWLGTYETPEEAGKAYADKKVEFDALAPMGNTLSPSVVSGSSQCFPSPASSSSASGPCFINGDDLSKEKMSLSKDFAASGDSTEEGFDFSELEIPDLSFLAAEEESTVSSANGAEPDFDWLLMNKDFNHMFDDFSVLDNDINISGITNSLPSELPDYDFTDVYLNHVDMKFAFADQLAPLNIAFP